MMNRLLLSLGGGVALVMASGCAADRFKPSQALPGTNVRNAPPEMNLTEMQILDHAAAQPPATVAGEGWRPLFDGHSLAGWRITEFGGQGRVTVRKGLLLLSAGTPFTGVHWTNDPPKMNYEISLEAMRVSGSDFFCGLTFPVRDSFCSLIVGGAFLAKVIQGGTEATLLAALKRDFATVKHVKPAASRSDSAELYVLATGFRLG